MMGKVRCTRAGYGLPNNKTTTFPPRANPNQALGHLDVVQCQKVADTPASQAQHQPDLTSRVQAHLAEVATASLRPATAWHCHPSPAPALPRPTRPTWPDPALPRPYLIDLARSGLALPDQADLAWSFPRRTSPDLA